MPSPTPRRATNARDLARRGAEAPTDPLAVLPGSDSLRALARRGELRRLRRGSLLISEGDRGDTLFIVVAGRLRAFGSGADGREVTYGSYGAGEYLGEMGLDGGERSASVEASEPSWVVVVTRPTLEAHLHADPAFAFELLAKVIWRARLATQNFKLIALNDVYSRLKTVLEAMAPAEHAAGTPRVLDPAPSHQDFGSRLGCSREMVSRVMKDLERGGYVEVGRRRIVLLRPLPAKW
jgi:CRP/FNR family cyclic AMP-dependent transcriptional regulator